jgi:decaprenyl-phosphate phosphoribosyltransferase
MKSYIKVARPEQYIKNLFIFAPLFFDGKFLEADILLKVILAFVCFCLAASAIYVLNDYCDIREDMAHPVKCNRPLAAGTIKIPNAMAFMLILAAISLTTAFTVSLSLLYVLLCYMGLNFLYSKWLKHITVLDVNIIAIGFVLRIAAGAAVAGVKPSIWILLITYLLALFLGFAKRRADVLLSLDGKEVRKNIDGYNLNFIDTVLSILASIIIVSYIFYTISPEVQQHYHSDLLYLSVVFVINGILYYMKLTLVDKTTYSPTLVALKDRVIQVTIAGWVILMTYLLYF